MPGEILVIAEHWRGHAESITLQLLTKGRELADALGVGLDVLVLDCLRPTRHPTHFSLSEALDAAARIGAARTYFTHVCHDLPHADTNRTLPSGVELAYDGLTFMIEAERWT